MLASGVDGSRGVLAGLLGNGVGVVTASWDRRVLRRSTYASRGRVGELLPAMSRVADRGLVWPALGAALCVRRATRGAGVGGIGAVLVCSAVTGVFRRSSIVTVHHA
jgi:hypothetical protein